MSINKQVQISDWLEKCKTNITEFKKTQDKLNEDEKKQFVKDQYRIVSVINNVLSGKTKLFGIDRHRFGKKD